MRRLLAERKLPDRRAALLRLGPLGGHDAAVGRRRDHRRGRRPRRPDRPRHRPLLRRGDLVARARPALRRRRRHRHRQLLGVADGSRRAARRGRGQPRRHRHGTQGDHRQPQLHDDGGDAGAQAAARRGRPRAPDRQHLPGRLRRRRGRCRRARQAGPPGRRPRRRAHPRRLGRRLPGAAEVRPPDRLQRAAARRQARRRRLVGDRRGAEAAQRDAQDPRHPRPPGVRHVRAGAGVRRPLAVAQRRVRPTDLRRAGDGAARRGTRRRAQRRAHAARGRRPRCLLRRPHPRRSGRCRRPWTGPVRQRRQPAQGRRLERRTDRRTACSDCVPLPRRPLLAARSLALARSHRRHPVPVRGSWPGRSRPG